MTIKKEVMTPYLSFSSARLRDLATGYQFDSNNPALTPELLELIAQRNEIAERIRSELFGQRGPVRLREVERKII